MIITNSDSFYGMLFQEVGKGTIKSGIPEETADKVKKLIKEYKEEHHYKTAYIWSIVFMYKSNENKREIVEILQILSSKSLGSGYRIIIRFVDGEPKDVEKSDEIFQITGSSTIKWLKEILKEIKNIVNSPA